MSQLPRTNCPYCGGYNTYTTFRLPNGDLISNCYRVSCSANGGQYRKGKGSIDDIHNLTQRRDVQATQEFKLPPYLINGIASQEACDWLIKNNTLDAYHKGLFTLYTDLVEERVCIPMYDSIHKEKVINLIGKTWNRSNRIKAKVYNKQGATSPFVVGQGTTVVIVEDFASAASVCRVPNVVGYALHGTSFVLNRDVTWLRSLSPHKIIIALDRDAILQGYKLHSHLTYYFSCDIDVIFLDKDFKNVSSINRIKRVLNLTGEYH